MPEQELQIKIRKATSADFDLLYGIGLATPEFRVGASGEFMERAEFMSAINNPNGTFLFAETGGKIAGFVYANRKDVERGPATTWACLVYLVVVPEFRGRGVAQKLYNDCIVDLKEFGVSGIYGWANTESDGGIIEFMKKNGFETGHKYVWMDKKI